VETSAPIFKNEAREVTKTEQLPNKTNRRAILFTSDGVPVQRQLGTFTKEEVQSLTDSHWFTKILMDTAVISSRLRSEKQLQQSVGASPQEWLPVWDKILRSHIDSFEPMNMFMEGLLQEKDEAASLDSDEDVVNEEAPLSESDDAENFALNDDFSSIPTSLPGTPTFDRSPVSSPPTSRFMNSPPGSPGGRRIFEI
jgi:hypothetical protein